MCLHDQLLGMIVESEHRTPIQPYSDPCFGLMLKPLSTDTLTLDQGPEEIELWRLPVRHLSCCD